MARNLVRPLFWSVAFAFGLGLMPAGRGEEPAKEDHKVFIEVCVAEISSSKLRSLGFDWSALTSFEAANRTDGEPLDLIRLLEAMSKDNLVRVLYHPRLATMSGRAASLQVGDAIRLDLVPKVPGEEQIQLEYRIELNDRKVAGDGEAGERRQTARRLVLDSATELAPGNVQCVSETRCRRTNDRGKVEETSTVVLLRADLKAPADIRTAAKPSPPILKGYIREVPGPAEELPPRPTLEIPKRSVELPKP
jgi:hypothetical protein